jgi:acyl-CoA synthetase (AMP-forming)/AMP-acid ligase II
MTLEDYLQQDAQLYPDKVALVGNGEILTYSQLYERVLIKANQLKGQSYVKGQIVTVRNTQSIDFVVTYFALHIIGCVVAPLEKSMPDELFDKVTMLLSAHEMPDGIADILYTTGTTGQSKGVIVSHRAIVADAENLIDGQGFSHELVFVINGPLNHIGSLSKIYPVVLLGATIIITDGLKNVNDFFSAFSFPAEKFATFLVPASIRILIQFNAERLAALADKIDFVETGAAAISHDDMKQLCHLLPKSRLYNTYASTETGIISTYNFNDGRCIAGCLGRPMKNSKVVITDGGLISCQGDTLMSGYVGEPERTATVLHDATVFTSDIGRLDDEGMLHLSGREDDVINVGGFKVAPTDVENAAMAHPDVADCICIPVKHPITGVALKLLVVTKNNVLNKKAIALFLKMKLEPYKIPMIYEKVESVRRTYNGKPDRKFYNRQS